MKKLIAVLIALAMVLSMSVMAFAEFNGVKSPADITTSAQSTTPQKDYDESLSLQSWQLEDYRKFGTYIDINRDIVKQGIYEKEDGSLMNWEESWKAYAAYVASDLKNNPKDAAAELVNIVKEGYVPAGDVISIVGQSVAGGVGGDGENGDLSGVVDQIIGSITGGNQEPEVSADAYADELAALINSGAEFKEITQKISDDLANGKIVTSQLPDIAKAISAKVEAGEIENNETVQQIVDFIEGLGGGEGGFEFPSFGDITLPWDNDNSSSGSFLDTILGIIGSIGDLFNPSEDPEEPTPGPSGDEPGISDSIPNTGDVSFVAVAAVAAVAGAAFVLTRKKNDAE